MRLCVLVSPSAALVAGVNKAGARVLEFDPADLTPEERAELNMASCQYRPDGIDWRDAPPADLYAKGLGGLHDCTPEVVRAKLAETWAARAAAERKKAEEEAAKKAERAAFVERVRTADPASLVHWNGSAWAPTREGEPADWYWWTAEERAAYKAASGPLVAEVERRNAERDRLAAAEKAKAAAEKQAVLDRLAAWVREQGSDLARLRLEEGYDCWVTAGRDDLAAAVAARVVHGLGLEQAVEPDGYDCDENEPRRCPTEAEIRLLRAARERAAAADWPATVELKRAKYTPAQDEYGDRDPDARPIARTELAVTIDGLPGGVAVMYFTIPAE